MAASGGCKRYYCARTTQSDFKHAEQLSISVNAASQASESHLLVVAEPGKLAHVSNVP